MDNQQNSSNNIKNSDNLAPNQRRIMSKVKPNRFCLAFQQRIRSSIRYAAVLSLIMILGYFSIKYLETKQSVIPFVAKDRSDLYRVKVLPGNLDDAALDKLPKESFSFLAMIDAGSSGCRAHVYRYGKLGKAEGALYVLPQHSSKKVKPGLSSFADKPTEAGESLKDLIAFIKEQVPEADWEVTPIWLKATAGLRMLQESQSNSILESVRSFLSDKKNSPFVFHSTWARIISGNEEGGFGWLAFNYLKKIIGPKKSNTSKTSPFAVIEMGGASAQVSQVAPSAKEASVIPAEYRFSFTIEEDEYHLYTHSYLGYGAEQAKERFLKIMQSGESPSLNAVGSSDPCKVTASSQKTSKRRLLHSSYHRYLQNQTEPQPVAPADATAAAAAANANSDQISPPVAAKGEEATKVSTFESCVKLASNLFSTKMLEAIGVIFPEKEKSTASKESSSSSSSSSSSCSQPGPYSFSCIYQPAFVSESSNILAFENFFYMSSALGVKSASHSSKQSSGNGSAAIATTFPLETTPMEIKAASDSFCSLDWNSVQASYPRDGQPKDVNSKMCFISGFAYSFLVDGLKIPADKTITIQKEVDSSEIEWALGAAYKEAASFLKRTNLRPARK